MSTVTRDTAFLNWLAEQLKLAEPQIPVVEGIILTFDEVVMQLEDVGYFEPASLDWSYYMLDVLERINYSPNQKTCSAKIFEFLTEIYDVSSVTYEVSRGRAIRIMLKMLGLDKSFIRRKRIAGRLHISSTPRFEQAYGMKVRTETALPKVCTNAVDFFEI